MTLIQTLKRWLSRKPNRIHPCLFIKVNWFYFRFEHIQSFYHKTTPKAEMASVHHNGDDYVDYSPTSDATVYAALSAWLDAGMPVPKSDQPIQVFDVVAWHESQTKSA